MTVVAAAIEKDGTVVMGADGACSFSDQNDVVPLTSPKVRRNGPFLIGCTGTARTVQIAHYAFKPPVPKKGEDLLGFMVRKFAGALRRCMKDEGGETKGRDGDETMDGRCLVAYGGRLFEVDSAYGIIDTARDYHAVGCAAQVAMGAMHAYKAAAGTDARARSMVQVALEASVELDINIRGPFTVERLSAPARRVKRPPPMKSNIPLEKIDEAIMKVAGKRK